MAIIEHGAGLEPAPAAGTGPERLRNLLYRLHHATGRPAVVLVDEYDKPILDALETPDLAKANRDYLRGFYGIIKDSARHVRFVLVTGVSMFSKVSLFSGLNNLEDISLDPRYATICGYTDGDLDRVFGPELPGLDRDEIRRWYNGYHWLGEEKVYNPFDLLLLFRRRRFSPYWFETGSPTFLYRMLVEKKVNPMTLENRVTDAGLVSDFDVDDIGIDALLFQTGYLTIAGETWDGVETLYTLDYPNFEGAPQLEPGTSGIRDPAGTGGLGPGEGTGWPSLGERLHEFRGTAAGVSVGDPASMVRPQRGRTIRGALRQHAVHGFPGNRGGPSCRGGIEPRPLGHGGVSPRSGIRAGVQDGGRGGGGGRGDGPGHIPIEGTRLWGEVQGPGGADPPGRDGVRPEGAEPAGDPARARLIRVPGVGDERSDGTAG